MPRGVHATLPMRPAARHDALRHGRGECRWRAKGLVGMGAALLVSAATSALADDGMRNPAEDALVAALAAAKAGGTVRVGRVVLSRPLVLARAVVLVGAGGDGVIDAQGERIEVTARGVVLRSLKLKGVRGVRIREGASLRLDGVEVSCVATATALSSVAGRVGIARSVIGEGCVRAIDLERGGLRVDGGRLEGEAGSIRLVEASATLVGVESRVRASDGVGVFGARSQVELRRVRFTGGEYGVLVRDSAVFMVDSTVDAVTRAGAAATGGTLKLVRAQLTGPFSHAGVSAAERCVVRVESVHVKQAGKGGVALVRAKLEGTSLEVTGASADGDGEFGHGIDAESSSVALRGLVVSEVVTGVSAGRSSIELGEVDASTVAWVADATNGSRITIEKVRAGVDVVAGVRASDRATVTVRHASGVTTGPWRVASCGGTVSVPDAWRTPNDVAPCNP